MILRTDGDTRPTPRGGLRITAPARDRYLHRSVAMLALMVLMLLIGRSSRLPGADFALLWPAVGVAVWWMLGPRPARAWIRDVSMLTTSVVVVNYATGTSLAVAATFGLINLAHGLVGAQLLDRTGVAARGLTGASSVTGVAAASAAAGLISGTLSAAMGTYLLGTDLPSTLLVVALRNTAGTFMVLMVVLALWRPGRLAELVAGERRGEWVVAITLGLGAYLAVFGLDHGVPVSYAVMPLFVWIGTRLGLARTVALTVALGLVATVLTIQGHGGFSVIESAMARAGVVQGFLVVSVLASAALAASQEEKARTAASLARTEVGMAALVDAALIGSSVLVLDGTHAGELVLPNPALQRLLRIGARPTPPSQDGVYGDDQEPERERVCWLSFLRPEDVPVVREVLHAIATGTLTEWSAELPHQLRDGSTVWAQVHVSVLPAGMDPLQLASAGRPRHRDAAPVAPAGMTAPQVRVAVVQFLDLTDRKDVEVQLTHQALHDALTGLPNRVLLRDRIGLALGTSDRVDAHVALVFLDLDHFKSVNDSLGHDAGDVVLIEVAQRLQQVVRPGDTIARIGGDEFVVCYPDIPTREHAEALAHRLMDAVSEPVWVGDRFISVAVSAGLTLSRPGDDAATLLRQSDAAMYAAKRSGRGRIASFDHTLQARATRHLTLSSQLRDALTGDQFVLHYQPIVDLHTGAVTGCEALVRWQHPTRGLLGPDQWLDVAEESDVIVGLGQWVLRQATGDVAALGLPALPRLHVNVSGRQLAEPALVDHLVATLTDSPLPAHLVVLELTETHLLEIRTTLVHDLERLRHLGVGLAVDDFGTGFSSLTQLVKLPVDCVKIDRSFITHATTDPKADGVMRGVLGMANALGLTVVAEGVETTVQADHLRASGCPAAQGFLWSPPVGIADLTALLTDDTADLAPPHR